MSATKIPDYRLRQKILHIDKTSTAALIGYGDLYLEAGLLSDALDCYIKAGHSTGLQKIKDLAASEGDTFLFQRAVRALNLEPSSADWEDVARRATELKKYFFARHALEKTNNAELLGALMNKIKAEEAKQSA